MKKHGLLFVGIAIFISTFFNGAQARSHDRGPHGRGRHCGWGWGQYYPFYAAPIITSPYYRYRDAEVAAARAHEAAANHEIQVEKIRRLEEDIRDLKEDRQELETELAATTKSANQREIKRKIASLERLITKKERKLERLLN